MADTNTTTDTSTNTTTEPQNNEVVLPDLGLSEAQQTAANTAEQNVQQIGALETTPAPAYQSPDVTASDYVQQGSKYVTPESTVAGQLEKYLSSDSDYMRRGETQAREKASALGLSTSSAAIAASRGASIDRAMPLAMKDAETYAKANQLQQQAENTVGQTQLEGVVTGAIKEQDAAIAQNQAKFNAQVNALSKGADAQTQMALTDFSKKWDMVMQDSSMRLEAALREQLANNEIDAQTISDVRNEASQMVVNYQISAEELLKDPDFLQLGPEAISSTMNNLLSTTTAGIQFLADFSGVNLEDWMDDFISNATFTAEVG